MLHLHVVFGGDSSILRKIDPGRITVCPWEDPLPTAARDGGWTVIRWHGLDSWSFKSTASTCNSDQPDLVVRAKEHTSSVAQPQQRLVDFGAWHQIVDDGAKIAKDGGRKDVGLAVFSAHVLQAVYQVRF